VSLPIIVAEDVTKIYQSQAVQVRALDRVSLRVNKGEVVAVMGASGSGKTTLLNCLAGLDSIDSGKIIVAGQDLAKLSEHELTNFRAANMGFIFQSFNLLPVLTAVENVELPLLIARCSPTEARHRAQTLLSEVGLAQRMQHYPGELSGGQRQRVAIARALIHDPTILWADEPTGSLDSDASQEIMDLLRAVNRTHGQTIVLVTHAQEIGAQVDRVIHMHDGHVVE
jgi:putative ABC transport system ATP-binding protein